MEGWSLRFVPIVCKNVCKAILYVYITDYYVRRIPKMQMYQSNSVFLGDVTFQYFIQQLF